MRKDIDIKMEKITGKKQMLHEKIDQGNIRNYIAFLWICVFVILLTAFVLTLLNVINLRIVNEIELPPYINYGGAFILFMINTFFGISIIIKLFDRRVAYLLLGYIPIYWISIFLFDNSLIVTALLPFLYLFAFIFVFKDLNISTARNKILKWFLRKIKAPPMLELIVVFLVRYAIYFLLLSAYQLISGYIKLGWVFDSPVLIFNNIIVAFLYSIDMYLVYILTYLGVRINATNKMVFWNIQQIVCICKEALSKSHFENELPLHELNRRQKILFYAFAYGWQLSLLLVVLFMGHFNVGLSETLILWIAFELGRNVLGLTYHAKSIRVCTVISAISFYILTKINLPFGVSLFYGIMLATVFTFILHLIAIHLEDDNQYDDIKNKIKRIKIKYIPTDKFYIFTEDQQSIIKLIQQGENIVKISQHLNMSTATINRRIKDIKCIWASYK